MNLKLVLLLLSGSVAQANTYVICEHAEPTNVICDSTSIATYSSTDHRLAEGMDYYWGYNNRKAFDKESGYAYYNFDCYYKQFTDVSRLYLLNIRANFTSGFIADRNNENGYNWMFDLDYGYIHIAAVSNFKDKNDTSSTVKLLTSWPDSSKSTSTITSAFSTNYNNNWGSTTELSWPAGVKISGSNSGSLSWTIDHSKSITTDEPYISTQTSPRNELEQQWNYQYKDLGKATYTLDTYYLLEVKNDAIGFDKYGFVFDLYINMSNVQWKNYWWESHDSQDFSVRTCMGLGRNPYK